MSIQIVLPAPLSRPEPVAGVTRARAWKRLPDRPVLGLIDNGKGRARDILEAVGRQLAKAGLIGSYFLIHKPSAGRPITPEERSDLLARADVVVSGVGDCGACSSCSLHDAALCLSESTPSAVIITTPFVRLAHATAQNLGTPTLPIMVVEHPIWTRDDDWIEATAQRLCDPLVAELLTYEEHPA